MKNMFNDFTCDKVTSVYSLWGLPKLRVPVWFNYWLHIYAFFISDTCVVKKVQRKVESFRILLGLLPFTGTEESKCNK